MRTRPDPTALVGRIVGGRYRAVQVLAAGGVAEVLLAERLDTNERVALKVLRPEHAKEATLLRRFEREADVLARLRHPHLVEGQPLEHLDDGRPLFAMELLVGLDLADTLAYRRSLEPRRAVRITSQIALGLGEAHAKSVVHRDIKPENLFVVHAADGRELPKILDFGYAHVIGQPVYERPDQVVGTPGYMAPEQARGESAAPAADLYALGVVLFEMLTGRVPFVGEGFAAMARAHATSPVPSLRSASPPGRFSPELEAAVRRALAKDPRERFASAADLARALQLTPEGGA